MRQAVADVSAGVVRNLMRLHPNTSQDGWFMSSAVQGGAASTTTVTSGLPFGRGRGGRITMTGPGTAAADGPLASSDGNLNANVRGGGTYTTSAWVRCSKAITVYPRVFRFNSTGGALGSHDGGTVVLSANKWTRISLTIGPVSSDTAQLRFDLRNAVASPLLATGDIFDITAGMCSEGPTLLGYADGTFPGWRWLGVDTGESVGHPQPDIRQMPIVAGPSFTDASGAAGVFTSSGTGPTEAPVGRVTRGPGGIGWGAYLAANLPGATILAGTPFEITWWQRTSDSTGTQAYSIIDDPAANLVLSGQSYARSTSWTKCVLTGTTLRDWTALHRLRTGIPDIADGWVEISDVKLKVPA